MIDNVLKIIAYGMLAYLMFFGTMVVQHIYDHGDSRPFVCGFNLFWHRDCDGRRLTN